MRFLEECEVEEWCAERDITLEDGEVRVVRDPRLTHCSRRVYANGKRSGREAEIAGHAVAALGEWDECLLWVTLVGVWASGEDWPAYYALRGAENERRSLDKASGHWFDFGERPKLVRFLTAVMENGWNAATLPCRGGRTTDVRLCVSHDEWIEVQSRLPVDFAAPAV